MSCLWSDNADREPPSCWAQVSVVLGGALVVACVLFGTSAVAGGLYLAGRAMWQAWRGF
jgi:hypothetical protein